MTAQRKVQENGGAKGLKGSGKSSQVHAPDVEEIIGGMSVPKVEPVKEDNLEEEKLATPKEDTPRAREKDSTTWESQVQRKIRGQDHLG